MTFSIVACCAGTGMFGVAVASSSPAVAARCAYARARVGAVASQNITDPTLGTRGLDLMALGASAPEAVAVLKATGEHIDYRQVLMVDAAGRVRAIHTGFAGPATGNEHLQLRNKFEKLIEQLLAEGE